MDTIEEFIPIGKVSGAYGVRGWLKVFSYTDPRNNILAYSPLYLSGKAGWTEVKVTGGRVQGKGIVMAIDGITDRDQVLALIGAEFAIKRSQFSPVGDDDYYWSDLIGLQVLNIKDDELGVVQGLLETGANDVLVVTDKHGTERLIPFVLGPIVKQVDLDRKLIKVDWEQDY